MKSTKNILQTCQSSNYSRKLTFNFVILFNSSIIQSSNSTSKILRIPTLCLPIPKFPLFFFEKTMDDFAILFNTFGVSNPVVFYPSDLPLQLPSHLPLSIDSLGCHSLSTDFNYVDRNVAKLHTVHKTAAHSTGLFCPGCQQY